MATIDPKWQALVDMGVVSLNFYFRPVALRNADIWIFFINSR